MSILFLKPSNQNQSCLGNIPDFQRNYDYEQWEIGFKAIGLEVFSYEITLEFIKSGGGEVGSRVQEIIQTKSVSLIIVPAMYFEVSMHNIDQWQKMGAKILLVFFDDSFRFENYNRYYIEASNFILTQETAGAITRYSEMGYKATFFPCFPSASWLNNNTHFDNSNEPDRESVVFIGANIANRSEYIDFLKKNSIDVTTFGRGWNSEWLETSAMYDLYRSACISISFTENIDENHPKVLKARPFEIAMAGGCLLAEENPELKEYFDEGEDALYFKNPSECVEKINFLRSHPEIREKMVQNSKRKSFKSYSFEQAWKRYLTELSVTENSKTNKRIYREVPKLAIENSIYWRIKIIFKRVKANQMNVAISDIIHLTQEVFFLVKFYRSPFAAFYTIKLILKLATTRTQKMMKRLFW
jgi:hypothetical protein